MECSLRLRDFLLLNHARRSTGLCGDLRGTHQIRKSTQHAGAVSGILSRVAVVPPLPREKTVGCCELWYLQEYLQHISLRHPSIASSLNSDND